MTDSAQIKSEEGDTELARLIQQIEDSEGASAAFRIFYFRYYDHFYRIAYYQVQQAEDARDVTLEAFAKIWEHRARLHTIADYDRYFYRVVKNCALSFLRTVAYRGQQQPLEEDASEGPLVASAEDACLDEELFRCYNCCIHEMPPAMRQAYVLVKEEQQSYAQAAEQLSVSPKTIDSQIQRAMQRLKKCLSSYLNESDRPLKNS